MRREKNISIAAVKIPDHFFSKCNAGIGKYARNLHFFYLPQRIASESMQEICTFIFHRGLNFDLFGGEAQVCALRRFLP